MEELIDSENRLGRMVDYGVIGARVDALYASSARALGEPRLLDLIRAERLPTPGRPINATCGSLVTARFTSLIEFLTRPRNSHLRLELAAA